jgi:hypothetical protein
MEIIRHSLFKKSELDFYYSSWGFHLFIESVDKFRVFIE